MMYQNKKHPSQKIVLALLAGFMLVALNMTAVDASVKPQSGNFNILAESTFDTGTEGWGIYNDGTAPTHSATGGESGGYIESKDKGLGTYWYWVAPAEFLGNKSAAYGGELKFYLRQNYTSDQRNQDDILFDGGGYSLVYDTLSNPGTGWTSSYTIPLKETSAQWTNKANGLAPTQAQMQAVLANLQSIKIRGEYRYGADIGWLDSVYLNSANFTPTPTLTSTPTATATFTPTDTPTATPTDTPTPTKTSTPEPDPQPNGYLWFGGWANYWFDSSVPVNFVSDVAASADTWTDVTSSSFAWYPSTTDGVAIFYGYIDGPGGHAGDTIPVSNSFGWFLNATSVTNGVANGTSVELDYEEIWYVGSGNNPASNQTDLRSVATHELGHALGLNHELNCSLHGSSIDATMCPITWRGTTWYRTLESDDILGVTYLYYFP